MSWNLSSIPSSTGWTSTCSSADGTVIYACNGDGGGTIFKSTNSGVTFTEIILIGLSIVQIVCNSSGTNILALDQDGNSYYSIDSGLNFNSHIGLIGEFISIAISDNTPPLLLSTSLPLNGAYYSYDNITWTLFKEGQFTQICCGNNVSDNTGFIYVSDDSISIENSQNGYLGLFNLYFISDPSGKLDCAYTSPQNIVTFNSNNLIYNTSTNISFENRILDFFPIAITLSYDGINIAIAATDGNIYLSTNGPTGDFNLTTGYPSETIWNDISGSSTLLKMVAAPMNTPMAYYSDVICFLEGSEILTDIQNGVNVYKKIENLKVGDKIKNYGIIKDNKHLLNFKVTTDVKITWIGKYTINIPTKKDFPVCITAGSISKSGTNTEMIPSKNIWVSQAHRIIIDNKLICARDLCNGKSIFIDRSYQKSFNYWHFQTFQHSIIEISGVKTETLVNTHVDYKTFFEKK